MSEPSFNFSTVLASSIHDIKNSLCNIQGHIKKLVQDADLTEKPELHALETEADQMHNNLMQLLILYKIDCELFKPQIDEYPVEDILADQNAQQHNLLRMKQITLECQCPEDFLCYCDSSLINIVLTSIINNSQRHCRKHIKLTAYPTDQYGVCFCIEDDGKGYSDQLLTKESADTVETKYKLGNTGLGLLFAKTIAQMHTQGDKIGSVIIDNSSQLGGARFRLFLP